MVRVKLPCFSAEAHGSIVPGVIFATNQHGQYVKFFVSRKKTATPAQQAVRNAYGEVAIGWRGKTTEQKATYHKKAVRAGITDYNQYFKEEFETIFYS